MPPKKNDPTRHEDPETTAAPAEYETAATSLTDAQPVLLAMTPAQLTAAETEKAALLEALRVPRPETPHAPTPVEVAAMLAPEEIIEERIEDAPSADVDAAIAERDRLQAEAERVKTELEQSERDVETARAQAAAHASAVVVRKVVAEIGPMRHRVEAQKKWLQNLHNEYNAALTQYGSSCASGTLAERSALMRVYSEAPGVQHKLALAFKSCTEALRLIDHAAKYRGEQNWNAALKACRVALEHDAAQIEAECAGLVERYSRVKSGGLNVVRIKLTDNGN